MSENNLRPITILVVDDHLVVRQGLRSFLDLHNDMHVVGEACSGEEAVELAQQLLPDIVLMDLVMPGMGGIEATRKICSQRPDTKVIALTSFLEDDHIFPALEAGVSGYLMKNLTPPDLARAIRTVYEGKSELHPDAAKKIIDGYKKHLNKPSLKDLTQREIQVLELVAQGLSNREIAEKLLISQRTVKVHVSNILSKLNLSDRTQAAIYALKNEFGG